MRLDGGLPGGDVERPSAARIYDYLLGGSQNFEVDRMVAEQVLRAVPDARTHARANRAFLRRTVQFCAHAGIDQFLDIGSGIPGLGNVHEVARTIVPSARVAYVDIDPVAVEHGRALLSDDPAATVVAADLRDPERILADQDVRRLIDPTRPTAVLLVAILHVIPDEDRPYEIVARIRDHLAPGSYLVIAHGTQDGRPENAADLVAISRQTPTPMSMRTRAEVARFFDGFTLVDPGLVWVPEWRPDSTDEVDDHPERSSNLGGVGRRE